MNHEERDLGDSLKITKTEGHQLNAGGTWVSGTIAGHTFQVLVFSEHAEIPSEPATTEHERTDSSWASARRR